MTCSITHPCDGLGSSPHPSPGSGSPAAASRRVQDCASTWREGSTAKSLLCPHRWHAAGFSGWVQHGTPHPVSAGMKVPPLWQPRLALISTSR